MSEDCRIERRWLARRTTLDMTTGKVGELDAGTWEVGPCGVPLFSLEHRKLGACSACLEGWGCSENSPTDKGWDQIEVARKKQS